MSKVPKRARKPGRPCKLTPDVHGRIVAEVGRGAFPWVAARKYGISPSTFYLWMQLGDDGDPQYSEFSEDVHKAAAGARIEAETAVRRTRPVDWLRIGPGRDRGSTEPGWTDRQEVTRTDGGPIEHVIRIVRE